jgi:hypothetical protein
MIFQAALFLGALFSTLTLPVFAALPKGTVTCGSNRYSPSQLTAAINAAIKDMNSGVYPGAHFDFELMIPIPCPVFSTSMLV